MIEFPVHIDYNKAFLVLEKSLVFIEQQKGVSAVDVLTFQRWRNLATEKWLNTKKQSKITDFFLKTNLPHLNRIKFIVHNLYSTPNLHHISF